ncbi:MAG: PAS domain-containing protein [Candidatus Mariimomonas ferrooxydans]
MELLALLSNRDDIVVAKVIEVLKKYMIYPVRTIEELEDLHANIPVYLILIDTVSYRLSTVEDLLNKLNDDMVVLIVQDKPDKFTLDNMQQSVFACVETQSILSELPAVVERAVERQRFIKEISLLRKTRHDSMPAQLPVHSKSDVDMFSERRPFLNGTEFQRKRLVNFAKMLTAGFDIQKLFSYFMDSIMEISRLSKMSIMLRDKEGFYVKTHHGLYPYIAESIRLKKDSAIVTWLARTGRILHKPVNPVDAQSINIKSEMELLQCSFSFPMTYKGKLIGIFNIDNKITEEPFYREELEIIYIFCNYLAVAVKDIDLYYQIWYQKEFTKNILSSMNSGVIAIDKNEKITVFNQQAAEFLNQEASEMMGMDLRSLPSPLGDILYATMADGTSYRRHEIKIHPDKMPIGINSFRLVDENKNPIGSGIVFTDLSDTKKLEEQERRAEKLEAINDLMAKIAHEVRTPLTSVQTYTQVMKDKYSDDEELNSFFSSTVIQSIRSLDDLIDKLIIFSSKTEYNFKKEDINNIINDAVDYISKRMSQKYKILAHGMGKPVYIDADRKFLIKAIYYLVLNIADRMQDGAFVTMDAEMTFEGGSSVEISLKYNGDKIPEDERQNLLKPLFDIDNLGKELNVIISHKIIENHKGSLDIRSEAGINTFSIKLPGIDRRSAAIPIKREHIERR